MFLELFTRLCQVKTHPGIDSPSGDGEGQIFRQIGVKIL